VRQTCEPTFSGKGTENDCDDFLDNGAAVNRPRLLIVDDNAEVRQLLRQVVEDNDALVVGEASEGQGAIDAAEKLELDIILLDVSMPVMGGFPAARELRKRLPGIHIIFVSEHAGGAYVNEAIHCGVRGYVSKASAVTELPNALRAVMSGSAYFPEVAEVQALKTASLR
jgi:DNA-binding NarL/FixJ family response regulator